MDFHHVRDSEGDLHSMSDFAGQPAMVVVFMSNRCPGVKAYDGRLRALHQAWSARGVQFLGVNPIDADLYPSEALAGMRTAAHERGLAFPYLKDHTQALARRFGASCTPHAFVLDAKRVIRYHGKIDDAFIEGQATVNYVENALQRLLAGQPVPVRSTPPLGCAIDWTHHGDRRARSRPRPASS